MTRNNPMKICLKEHFTIDYFHIPIIHLVPPPTHPKIFAQVLYFQFLLGFTVLPRGIGNNAFGEGINKVYYGRVKVVNRRLLTETLGFKNKVSSEGKMYLKILHFY